eukprot:GILK01003322.1.p1 GENE.GILK01003322.1~~GILK01003322.1.p1  ORF type:complete len:411 (-),score=27.23 GILK01003322.1:90-1280(-)
MTSSCVALCYESSATWTSLPCSHRIHKQCYASVERFKQADNGLIFVKCPACRKEHQQIVSCSFSTGTISETCTNSNCLLSFCEDCDVFMCPTHMRVHLGLCNDHAVVFPLVTLNPNYFRSFEQVVAHMQNRLQELSCDAEPVGVWHFDRTRELLHEGTGDELYRPCEHFIRRGATTLFRKLIQRADKRLSGKGKICGVKGRQLKVYTCSFAIAAEAVRQALSSIRANGVLVQAEDDEEGKDIKNLHEMLRTRDSLKQFQAQISKHPALQRVSPSVCTSPSRLDADVVSNDPNEDTKYILTLEDHQRKMREFVTLPVEEQARRLADMSYFDYKLPPDLCVDLRSTDSSSSEDNDEEHLNQDDIRTWKRSMQRLVTITDLESFLQVDREAASDSELVL